jgi:hypothetical protein
MQYNYWLGVVLGHKKQENIYVYVDRTSNPTEPPMYWCVATLRLKYKRQREV